MGAILSMLNGSRNVDIVSSSEELSKRDCAEYEMYMAKFNLSSEYTENFNSTGSVYASPILYGTAHHFAGGDISDRYTIEQTKLCRGVADCVIIDEVDDVLIDHLNELVIVGEPIPGMQVMKSVYNLIFSVINVFSRSLTNGTNHTELPDDGMYTLLSIIVHSLHTEGK